MEAPPQPEQAAGEAHAETSQRRSSSRAARPAAGSLNVASLEQRYVSNDVFGGRRKAGQPRESLYVKGSEPENVVEITANTAIPELMQLTESTDPEAQKLSLSFLLNTDAPMADSAPSDFAPIAAPPTPAPIPAPAPAAASVPPPPPPAAAEVVPLPGPPAPLTRVITKMLTGVDPVTPPPLRPRAAKRRLGPPAHETVRTPPPVAPPHPARAKVTPTRRGRELSIPLNVEEVNQPESVALRDAAYWQNVIEKTEKEDDIERGFWRSAQEKWQEATFINCDLRYFNLAALGKFDVVLIDPPWRIKGNELLSSERRMFNNSTYQHSYGTLSNSEIIDIDVGCLCDKGFIFLWVINSQLMFGLECLKKWGYTYTDRIVWVRKNHNGNIAIGQGFYFLHSTETVLIGVKYAKGECLEFISKVSNDVIFAEIRERSRKPDQLYGIIERMCPGSRKIELFARNHNIRKGWLSLGNELGEYYDWDHDLINCDHCKQPIKVGTTRYKSRTVMDHDLCGKCLKELKANEDEYFEIDNTVPDMVFHEYFECDSCHTKPIWGIRFHCLECPNLDLCEACYDAKFLPPGNPEHKSHIFKAIELPDLAGGMPVHRFRCAGCNVLPIIGYLFVCGVCAKLYLCQKCFFKKKQPRNHRSTHDMEIVCVSDTAGAVAKCDVCGVRPIPGDRFRCTSCYLYEICEECHAKGAEPPKHIIAHKPSHKFTRIKAEPIE